MLERWLETLIRKEKVVGGENLLHFALQPRVGEKTLMVKFQKGGGSGVAAPPTWRKNGNGGGNRPCLIILDKCLYEMLLPPPA